MSLEQKEQEYFDMTDFLEYVQNSSDWQEAIFKEEQEDMNDELIYYNEERNLAFKFIKDEETNTVGMKKIDPEILEIKAEHKNIKSA